MNNISEYILRFFLGALLLYFGFSQILNPEAWVGFIDFELPEYFNLIYLVIVNGSVEIFFGILILFGVYQKWSSIIMGTHILIISFTLGFTPIGMRDFAISGALFALAFLENK